MLVKEHSTRLPQKNTRDFGGKPMFMVNLEKMLTIFDKVYVSSDSHLILKMAEDIGAKKIYRGLELCGDVPDIPVFQDALTKMESCAGIVAVHADTPLVEPNLIGLTKHLLEIGIQEVMTCKPITRNTCYKEQHCKVYGSIRGMTKERLENYGDPYKPTPDVWLVDPSLEIETFEDYEKAKCLIHQS